MTPTHILRRSYSPILVAGLLSFTMLASGCEFFGKAVPKPASSTSAGSLEEVPSAYRGSWSYIDVASSTTNTPTAASLTRFTFNATTTSRFQYVGLFSDDTAVDLTGIAAYDNKLPALLMALSQGTDPTASFMGKTLQLSNPKVQGATLTYGSSSTGTRYLYADPGIAVAAPQGVWKFDGAGSLDFIVISESGYAVAQMRDENNDPVLLDAIVRPDVDGSLTLEFFAVFPETSLGNIFFLHYAVEPNGDLTLEDADGSYTGVKL
mgnify:CR=1 FL=1